MNNKDITPKIGSWHENKECLLKKSDEITHKNNNENGPDEFDNLETILNMTKYNRERIENDERVRYAINHLIELKKIKVSPSHMEERTESINKKIDYIMRTRYHPDEYCTFYDEYNEAESRLNRYHHLWNYL